MVSWLCGCIVLLGLRLNGVVSSLCRYLCMYVYVPLGMCVCVCVCAFAVCVRVVLLCYDKP